MFKVSFRNGPKTEKLKLDSLDAAIAALAERAEAVPERKLVDLRHKQFEPIQQVAARGEIAGPGARGGVDVRGDGSVEAWTGRWSRSVVTQEKGETAYDALRRALKS